MTAGGRRRGRTDLSSIRYGLAGRRLSAELVVDDQRRRIIAAVCFAAAERGYERTAVRDIIEVAGVSRRTFYDLFADKSAAFIAAHEEALGLLCDRVHRTCAGQAEWPLAVSASISAALELAWAQPMRARLLTSESMLCRAPFDGRENNTLIDRLGPGLREGRQRASTDLPPILEEALLGGLSSVVAARLREGALSSLPELASSLSKFVLTPYLGAVEAREAAHRAIEKPGFSQSRAGIGF